MDEESALVSIVEGVARAALALSTPSHWDPLLSVSIGATGPARSIAGLGRTTSQFRQKLHDIARNLGTQTNDLALVISFETAGTFSPTEENPISHALGLLQFMPNTLDKMGVSQASARSMSAVEQLDLVEQYLRPWQGHLKSLSRLYMAVLWPRLVGADERSVLFAEGSREYAQNKGLDIDHDGRVIITEATARVRSMRHAPTRLLLLGDSIAEGLEPHLRRIATADGAEVAIGVHKRGAMVEHWAEHAHKAAIVSAPSVAVVALGSNDAAARRQPRAEHIERIVKASGLWGGEVYWLTPFEEHDQSASLSGLVWQASAIPLEGPTVLRKTNTRTTDGVHLTPNDYAAVAGHVWGSAGGTQHSPNNLEVVTRGAATTTTTTTTTSPRNTTKVLSLVAAALAVAPAIMMKGKRS